MVPLSAVGHLQLEQRSASAKGVRERERTFERGVTNTRELFKNMQLHLASAKHSIVRDFDSCFKAQEIKVLNMAFESVERARRERKMENQQRVLEAAMSDPVSRARLELKASAVQQTRRDQEQGLLPDIGNISPWDKQVKSLTPLLMLRSPTPSSQPGTPMLMPISPRIGTPLQSKTLSQSKTPSQTKTSSQSKNNSVD